MQKEMQCPICEHPIQIPETEKERTRITCPHCFAQLGLRKHKGEWILGCAFCKEPTFDPGDCDECERRHEKKKLIEDGKL